MEEFDCQTEKELQDEAGPSTSPNPTVHFADPEAIPRPIPRAQEGLDDSEIREGGDEYHSESEQVFEVV